MLQAPLPPLSLSLSTHSLTHSLSLTHLLFIAFAFVFFHRFRYFSHSDVHATNLKTPMAVNAPCNGCVSRFFLEIGCLLIPRNVGGIISSTGTNHGLTVWSKRAREARWSPNDAENYYDLSGRSVREHFTSSHLGYLKNIENPLFIHFRLISTFHEPSAQYRDDKLWDFLNRLFFSGEGGGSEVGGVDQSATAGSAKSVGLFPAEACREGALCGHPGTGNVLRSSQVRTSQ